MKIGGKQHRAIVDRSIRDAAAAVHAQQRTNAQQRHAPGAPITPEQARGAREVYDARRDEWRPVRRVNAKSVTVPNQILPREDDRLPYSRITDAR